MKNYKRESGSISRRPLDKSTKLSVHGNKSCKTTLFGKEERSSFSFEFEQAQIAPPPSKKNSPQGNWRQFWLGIVIQSLLSLILFFLSK
jgi:hypothetical protein